jgi:hypothetical protein
VQICDPLGICTLLGEKAAPRPKVRENRLALKVTKKALDQHVKGINLFLPSQIVSSAMTMYLERKPCHVSKSQWSYCWKTQCAVRQGLQGLAGLV